VVPTARASKDESLATKGVTKQAMPKVRHANRNGNAERERPRRDSRTLAEHVRLINKAWQSYQRVHAQKVRAIITLGRRLEEALDELGWGNYGKLFAPNGVKAFDKTKAERLRKIVRNPALTKAAHALFLPASWYVLYVLADIPAPQLEQLIETGVVHRELERKEAEQLLQPAEIDSAEHHMPQRQMLQPTVRNRPWTEDRGGLFGCDVSEGAPSLTASAHETIRQSCGEDQLVHIAALLAEMPERQSDFIKWLIERRQLDNFVQGFYERRGRPDEQRRFVAQLIQLMEAERNASTNSSEQDETPSANAVAIPAGTTDAATVN